MALANELSRFTLTPDSFLFGLGYPLAGVPALWLGLTGDPFMPFNLFAFVFAAYATYQTGRRLVSPAVGAVAGFALIFASPLILYTIVPWNSTVSLVAFSGLLLIASRPAAGRGLRYAVIASALVTWAFAARYIDLFWVFPLALAALYRDSLRASLKYWAVVTGTALVLVLPLLAVHNEFFGSPLKTPYSRPDLQEQSLSSYKLERVPRNTVALLVGSDQAGVPDHHRGLLTSMFWALAALPGAYLLLRKPGRTRLVFGTVLAVTAVGGIFYLSYRGSNPDILKFGTTHYFKLFAPGIAIMAATALVALWPAASRRRRG